MSNQLSSAQALPVDVIRSILKWVVQETKSQIHGTSCKVDNLKELLDVGSRWRQVSLEYLWHKLNLEINLKSNKVNLHCPRWVKEKTLPCDAENLVKEIQLHVFMPVIISGVAQQQLMDYMGDTKSFPLVNRITVYVKASMNHHVDDKATAITNVLEFAKLLKSLAPEAATMDIISDGEYFPGMYGKINPIGEFYGEILESLASVLYANTIRAQLNLCEVDITNMSTIDSIPPLSQLSLDYTNMSDVYGCLMHKSASTLQYLRVPIDAANKLLLDDKEETVIYPKLQHLELVSFLRGNYRMQVRSSAATPFPVLRTLKMDNLYPFDDDLPFRGNSGTLVSLDIRLDNHAIVVLNRERVFESNYKVLRNVSITRPDVNRDRPVDAEVDIDRLLYNLVGAATSLTVSDYRTAMDCLTAAQRGEGFQNITVFNVRSYALSLFEVLGALKALPALVTLEVSFGGLGPEFDHLSADELPDHVAFTYQEAGNNLLIWRMTSFSSSYNAQYVDCLLLLALASPRLHRLEMMSDTVKDYHSRVARALKSGPYSKYAVQLNRLLDIAYDSHSREKYI